MVTKEREFILKVHLIYESTNLVYIVICPTCNEKYIGRTGKEKTKISGRVRVHQQHIRQPQYRKTKRRGTLSKLRQGRIRNIHFIETTVKP